MLSLAFSTAATAPEIALFFSPPIAPMLMSSPYAQGASLPLRRRPRGCLI